MDAVAGEVGDRHGGGERGEGGVEGHQGRIEFGSEPVHHVDLGVEILAPVRHLGLDREQERFAEHEPRTRGAHGAL